MVAQIISIPALCRAQIISIPADVEDVYKGTLKLENELRFCTLAWGKLHIREAREVENWLEKDNWSHIRGDEEHVLVSVLAYYLGRPVCAEGAVAVAAWLQSDGDFPKTVDLYRRALKTYAYLSGARHEDMAGDHDSTVDGERSEAFRMMERYVGWDI